MLACIRQATGKAAAEEPAAKRPRLASDAPQSCGETDCGLDAEAEEAGGAETKHEQPVDLPQKDEGDMNGESKELEQQTAVPEPPPQVAGERIEPQGEARRIPISDLETLRQLEDIQGGCTVCILR